MVILERNVLENVVSSLREDGYTVIGPARRGAAIILDQIHNTAQLPAGTGDEQGAGTYRLRTRDDAAVFGYAASPHSWKQFLFPPVLQLMTVERAGKSFAVKSREDGEPTNSSAQGPKYAFFGMRPCDLAALRLQDAIFMGGQFVDPAYQRVRRQLFIIAVNCSAAGGTCFCSSMGCGPRAAEGHDLVLTEVVRESAHHFAVEAGSERGEKFMERIPHRPATDAECDEVNRLLERTAATMGRFLNIERTKTALAEGFEHPRWDAVAKRCLACGNCTSVCPTCFCSTVEDVTDLSGSEATRVRKWDSCFTLEFTYIHGGSVRPTIRSRYRQWMTHKLLHWNDQFGASGCVGCGRCITWCPVGIDITEEARMMQEQTTPRKENSSYGTA